MRSIVFLIGFFIAESLWAQTVTVKDREDLSVLELVTFVANDLSTTAVSNAKGQIELKPFEFVQWIEIRRLGYKTKVLNFEQIKARKFQILLEPKPLDSDQVVVSASRWKERASEVPSRIAVISSKEITMQQPQTAADLLTASGQVYVQKSQLGGGSPMIRGFSTNRLLISVDGVRMNNAIFRSGNLQNVINIDPFSLQQTEVLFGPGSVMYGSDAIGGVMDFTTTKPRFSIDEQLLVETDVASRYSSANQEKTAHLGLRVGSQKWAYIGNVTYFDFSDLRMGSDGPDEYLREFYVISQNGIDTRIPNPNPLIQRPTAYNQFNTLQKIKIRPMMDLDLEYAFHYSTTTNYSRYDRLLRTRNNVPRSAVWNYGPQEWSMHQITLENRNRTNLYDEFVLRLALQEFGESRIDRDFNDEIKRNRKERVLAYSFTFDFSKQIEQNHRFTYGLDFIYNDINSRGFDQNISENGTPLAAPSRYPQSNWTSLAAFLSHQYSILTNLKWVSGARYNHYLLNSTFSNQFYPFPFSDAKINDGALTGSVGAIWNPTQTFTISSTLSTGFRTPNVDDIGKVFDSEPGSVVVPNPNLSAEFAYSAELGVAHVFDDRIKWDASVFYTILDDAMVRRNFTLNGLDSLIYSGELSQIQAVQNAAQARVWGVQAGLTIDFTAGWSFQTKYSYQKGEEELDNGTIDPLRHAAPWFGTTKLVYSRSNWRSEINLQYNGEVPFSELALEEREKDFMYAIDKNGNPYSPFWYVVNIKSVYQVNEQWTFTAGLENVLDKRYRPYSSGLVAPGRNVIIALKGAF